MSIKFVHKNTTTKYNRKKFKCWLIRKFSLESASIAPSLVESFNVGLRINFFFISTHSTIFTKSYDNNKEMPTNESPVLSSNIIERDFRYLLEAFVNTLAKSQLTVLAQFNNTTK